jgi:hypothetical protein
MITILRDLNEGNPCTTDSWRAAAFHVPTAFAVDGEGHQCYAVAWGECYAQLSSGVRPLGWGEDDNTDASGVEWYDSREDALARLEAIGEAVRS